jgi:hypothetical protein
MAPDFSRALLRNDVALLDDMGTADNTLATLAADHADRTKTLLEAIQCPSYARAIALSISQKLLDCAKGIDARTVQEPELVNVGV